MLFLLPGMLFSPLSPPNFYSNFSIRVAFLEPPSTPIMLAQHQGLSCHRSQIILPMELFVQHMPPHPPEDRNLPGVVLLAQCQQTLTMQYVEINECTNCPLKSEFMSEDKWLPSLLAHSFPTVQDPSFPCWNPGVRI